MKSEELEKICEGVSLRLTHIQKLTLKELKSMLEIVNLCTEVVIKDKEGKIC